MVQQTAARVPLVISNVTKCMCTECGVQEKSRCVSELKEKLPEALTKSPLKREDIPGVYCGAGKATCPDIGPGNCICYKCQVFKREKLVIFNPLGYYCRDGASR